MLLLFYRAQTRSRHSDLRQIVLDSVNLQVLECTDHQMKAAWMYKSRSKW